MAGPNGFLYGSVTAPAGDQMIFQLASPAMTGEDWTETSLHSFPAFSGDGTTYLGPVTIGSSGELFGTASGGGTLQQGVAYSLAPPTSAGAAWNETILYNFGANGPLDPAYGGGGLLLGKSKTLFGVSGGGAYGEGAFYSLTPPAEAGQPWTEQVLYSFGGTPGDGTAPSSDLVQGPKGTIFGVTQGGGSAQLGTAYELTPPATQGGNWTEQVIFNFEATGGVLINPQGPLALGANGVLYGETTASDEATETGFVFELTPGAAGWTETVLYSFSNEIDGYNPWGGLVISKAGALVGATESGGRRGLGVIFGLVP